MCKWIEHGAENRRLGYPNLVGDWPVERQEQLLAAAGMRSLHPLGDQDGNDPLNVECLECGAAQADTLFGVSEGIRLSWLPCAECNAKGSSRRRRPSEHEWSRWPPPRRRVHRGSRAAAVCGVHPLLDAKDRVLDRDLRREPTVLALRRVQTRPGRTASRLLDRLPAPRGPRRLQGRHHTLRERQSLTQP